MLDRGAHAQAKKQKARKGLAVASGFRGPMRMQLRASLGQSTSSSGRRPQCGKTWLRASGVGVERRAHHACMHACTDARTHARIDLKAAVRGRWAGRGRGDRPAAQSGLGLREKQRLVLGLRLRGPATCRHAVLLVPVHPQKNRKLTRHLQAAPFCAPPPPETCIPPGCTLPPARACRSRPCSTS